MLQSVLMYDCKVNDNYNDNKEVTSFGLLCGRTKLLHVHLHGTVACNVF